MELIKWFTQATILMKRILYVYLVCSNYWNLASDLVVITKHVFGEASLRNMNTKCTLNFICSSGSRFHDRTLSLRVLGKILRMRVLRLEVFVYCTLFTLQTSFKPLLPKGGKGEWNPLVEVTVNSKEENF